MQNLNLGLDDFLSKALKLFIYFGIAFYPVYVLPSGSIQISHYFFFIFSIFVLIKINIHINKYFFIFLFYLIYCSFVELLHTYHDISVYRVVEFKYLKELLFLTYNFILTTSLLSYLNYQKKFNFIIYSLATAIIIIFFTLLYMKYFTVLEYRFEGFFNNPNQLGYFCVCSFSLIYLFYRNLYISYNVMIFSQLIVIAFSILTLSKAAIIALLLSSFFTIKPFNYKYSKIIEAIIILTLIFLFIAFFMQISDMHVYPRILNTFNESDSSLEVRGYLAYLDANSIEAIFGMGTKGVYDVRGYEVHSTFAMILTAYGLIGFLIFGLLMLIWILDIKKSYGLRGVICICGPSLLYGLTHNGIRFSMFWVLFAISIFLCNQIIKQKNFNQLEK